MNQKFNIVLLTHQPFPNGLALTNRIITYAKGFVANNSKIKVIVFKPTENYQQKILNTQYKGIYSNIPFEYSGKATVKSTNFLFRRFQNFFAFIRGIFLLFKENSIQKIDAFIVCSNSFSFEIAIFILAKILNSKFIKEESEFPEIYFWKKGFYNKFQKFRYIKIIYKLYDGILLITNFLIEYFSDLKIESHKLHHVPMTVEFDRFNPSAKDNSKHYIAYSGSINLKKDGIDILIQSFGLIATKYPLLKLYLIGKLYENFEEGLNSKILEKMIIENGLEGKVVLTGQLDRVEIINYLQNATLLVMSRPSSIQSQGGFPTKLGEYLATANAVVITNVGEISHYLTDNESAYIAEPDSVTSFAQKLDLALSNPQKAVEIGFEGRKVALTHFNYITQAQSIIQFLKELK